MDRKTFVGFIGGTLLAGSLAFGGLSIQDAMAQTPVPAQTTPAQTTPAQTPPDQLAPADGFGKRGGHGHGRGGGLVEATAQVTGLTVEQVRTELAAGKTPAQVAEADGKTADDVVNAAVATLKTKLDAEVAAGTITQAQADERLAQATEHLKTKVTQAGPGGDHGRGGKMGLVQATADVTGLTAAQVQAELAAGQSLAQVAEANGKTADDIIASLKIKGEELLTQRLEQARQQLAVPGGQ